MPAEPAPLRPAAFHILLALAGESLHGLGIAQSVDAATEGTVRLGPGTLYRTLKELRSDGFIEEAGHGADDPRRRPYRLTAEGRHRIELEAQRLSRIVEVARRNRVLPETP